MYEKRAKSWFLIYCKWLFVEVSAFEPDMAPYPRVSACQFEIKGRSQSAHCNNLKRFPRLQSLFENVSHFGTGSMRHC